MMAKTQTISIGELGRDQFGKVQRMVKEMTDSMIQMESLKEHQKDIKARCKEEIGLKDSDFQFLVRASYDQAKLKEQLAETDERVNKAQEMGLIQLDD
jgi:hypothetical protein